MTTIEKASDIVRFLAEVPEPKSTEAPTRVVHSSPVWLPATQTWMFNQANSMPGSVENHVVCETTANLEQFDLPNLHCLANGSTFRYVWDKVIRGLGVRNHLGHLPGIAKRIDADVLHSHFGHIGWMNLEAARRMRAAHVVTFYGQDVTYLPRIQPRWKRRYEELFDEVSLVLCEGPHMASKVAELGCPSDKLRVHHLGVDIAGFQCEARHRAAGEPFRVLMAGSFTEKKGIPDGLRALARIRDEVDLHVTLIGDANDEPRNQDEKRKILDVIEEYGLMDKVELKGYQPQSVLMYAAYTHHVFLSPSVHAEDGDTEGGAPVTILEMAASGMPVVSTRHCDIPAIVREDESALLADEHDVETLADHLRTLVAHPERWGPMGEAGRRHVEVEYHMARQGEALAQIYREL